MRDDIAKKLVERPRYGGGGKYKLRSNRRKGKNPELWDSLPQKESCKKPNIVNYNGKYLSEFFPPLEGFLRKNVGRPWNKVNSELRAHLSVNSTTHKHVLDHLYRDFVELNPQWVDGVPCHSSPGYKGKFTPIAKGRWYVDAHGLLKEAKYKARYTKPKKPARVAINTYEEYRQIDGVWFWVKYRNLHPGDSGYDVILRREFKMSLYGCFELEMAHQPAPNALPGTRRLAIEKRQLSKRTIRDEGLDKL